VGGWRLFGRVPCADGEGGRGGGGGGGVPVNSRLRREGARWWLTGCSMDEDGEDADEGGAEVRRMRMRVKGFVRAARGLVKWQYRPMRIRMLSSWLVSRGLFQSVCNREKPSLHYHRSVLALWRVG